jgi:putative flippase GtrA
MSKIGDSPATIVFSFSLDSDAALQLVGTVLHRAREQIEGWRCSAVCIVRKTSLTKGFQTDGDLHLLEERQEESVPPLLRSVQEAIENLKAEVIVELDEEGAREPDLVPRMLQDVSSGADLVLCSGNAKLPGARVRKRGRTLESLLSRIALFCPTKAWFRITNPTAGNRAYRVSPLVRETAERSSTPSGFRFESLYRMVRDKRKVVEILPPPVPAGVGPSDQPRHSPLRTFLEALRIRWKDPETRRFVKFGTVGFTGYLINASALELFRNIRLSYLVAHFFSQFPVLSRFSLLTSQSAWSAGLAAEVAILSNYLLNNFWTFSSHRIRSPLKFIGKMLQFNLTSFGGIVIQFFVIGLATMLFEDTALVRGVALVLAIVFLIIPYNWTIYNRLIWRVKRRKGR